MVDLYSPSWRKIIDERDALRSEVEHLKAASLDSWQAFSDSQVERLKCAEIERLKAELDKAWRAALDQGKETGRVKNAVRRHIAMLEGELELTQEQADDNPDGYDERG